TFARTFLDAAARSWRDRAGNVSIIFGFAMLPALGLIGAAVDYTRASRIKTQLQAAADSASVGSVSQAAPGYTAALAMQADGAVSAGQAHALNLFNGDIQGKTGFALTNLTATVNKTNWQLTSTVQFTATVPTVIMEVLGFNIMTVSGSAT